MILLMYYRFRVMIVSINAKILQNTLKKNLKVKLLNFTKYMGKIFIYYFRLKTASNRNIEKKSFLKLLVTYLKVYQIIELTSKESYFLFIKLLF